MSGVTLRFLLEVATVQLSSWYVGSLFPSLACDISMLTSFVSASVEPIALLILYVSPLLIILIGGICIFLAMGVYFAAFSSLLPHFHWSIVSHVRLCRLHRRNCSCTYIRNA